MKKILFPTIAVFLMMSGFAQHNATITDTTVILKTYPFSDPDPIPRPDIYYYPWFRFDGFSVNGEDQAWKEVILENDYIRVSIFPEIGGKIWGAIEKSTGNEFVYYNSVVKFRDIAMRGPWTSGGIELNFGIIGHSPNTSTPVDYAVQTNEDGSVSCFLSATDLFTRTRWETEVNLPKDKAFFTTKTIWHNPTPLEQPYYQWMNGAFQAEGNLEFCFPGTHWIGHDGQAHNWPVDEEGRDLSWYDQNNFGGDKSYHIVDGINEFFGAYWHDTGFGSVHYAPYGEKLGRKIFLWSHARSGEIWEDLLTDNDGQYVEFQSGRLFNQAVSSSTKTPFKHHGFKPYATDIFTEYWFPVKNTGGVTEANTLGALNVEKEDGQIVIRFCPVQRLNERITVLQGNRSVFSAMLDLDVLETWEKQIENEFPDALLTIIVGGNKLVYKEKNTDEQASRPVKAPADFDWQSVYGLYIDGVHWMHQNNHERAMTSFQNCLDKDPYYAPALNKLSGLYYRKAQYEKALEYVRRSISINAYDPEGNFNFGLINKVLGHYTQSQDGFAVATLSPLYRKAAHIELAKLFLKQNNPDRAGYYALKVLESDSDDPEASKLMTVISREMAKPGEAADYIQRIRTVQHLNHHADFEQWLLDGRDESKSLFINRIKWEMPQETFLEMAHWYQDVGDLNAAVQLLEMAPENPLVYLNLAHTYNLLNDPGRSEKFLEAGIREPVDFVFPFRTEELNVLNWASTRSDNWKIKYYLGLLNWSLDNEDRAKELFVQLDDQPGYPYFYLARASLLAGETDYNPEHDLLKARASGVEDWRISERLIDFYLQDNQTARALEMARESLKKFPSNNTLKYVYAKCLMADGKYAAARKALMETTILPNEGARYGRVTYRQACIMESIEWYKEGKYRKAVELTELARLWPENLGAGKPYDVDERLEDFLEAQYLEKRRSREKAEALYRKIVRFTEEQEVGYTSTDFLYLIALRKLDQEHKIDKFLQTWEEHAREDPALHWSRSALAGSSKVQNDEADLNVDNRSEGTPWDPRRRDQEFELIKVINDVILKE